MGGFPRRVIAEEYSYRGRKSEGADDRGDGKYSGPVRDQGDQQRDYDAEQNARQALECCDYGVVMELGRNKLFDRASEVLAHPEIRRLFLGL